MELQLSQRRAIAVLVTVLLAGSVAGAAEEPAFESETLNQGYGLLYEILSQVRDTDKILYVKLETKPVEKLASRLASTAGRFAAELEKLADDGEIDIEKTGLPEVEQRAREATRKSQSARMAPLIGESGAAFERTLLLAHLKAIDQLRHLTDVLRGLERRNERRKLLEESRQELEKLYDDVNGLLERRYFCEEES